MYHVDLGLTLSLVKENVTNAPAVCFSFGGIPALALLLGVSFFDLESVFHLFFFFHL